MGKITRFPTVAGSLDWSNAPISPPAIERVEPVRAPTLAADVLVPAARAAIYAFVAFLLLTVAWAVLWGDWAGLVLVAALALGVFGWTWHMETVAGRELLWKREVMETPAPPPVPLPRELEATRIEVAMTDDRAGHGGHSIQFLDLPVPEPVFALFVRGALRGIMSEATCQPLTRGQFRAVRDDLRGRGMLRWKDSHAPRQGLELTAVGRTVLRMWLEAYVGREQAQ